MAKQMIGPRKQRTRQHIIADQSVNYVERFIIDEGHTTQQTQRDYGYDLLMFTYDEQGYVEPGFVAMQLKAMATLQVVGFDYVYDVDIRDYNLWMAEDVPVILILFDASRRRAYWLDVQRYFLQDEAHHPKQGAQTVRVRVPLKQPVTRHAIAKMRDRKRVPFLELKGVL